MVKYYSLNVDEPLETLDFEEPPIIVCHGVAQTCSKVGVALIWSSKDGNLSYLRLGTASLLVPEKFKLRHFET